MVSTEGKPATIQSRNIQYLTKSDQLLPMPTRTYKEIIDLIRTIFNKPEGIIPLHEPAFTGNEKKYLQDCVDSTFVSSVGEYVDRFEMLLADYTRSTYAVA